MPSVDSKHGRLVLHLDARCIDSVQGGFKLILSSRDLTPPQERDGIQASFCSGEVRVMVATVAFGMGLDAPGVRGVVHATLPRSLEEYVQQVQDIQPGTVSPFIRLPPTMHHRCVKLNGPQRPISM